MGLEGLSSRGSSAEGAEVRDVSTTDQRACREVAGMEVALQDDKVSQGHRLVHAIIRFASDDLVHHQRVYVLRLVIRTRWGAGA
ncbi:hypothetical protein BG28_13515 [Nesterenkonia sp. AN1]|nr:hypothetical protein BG28_13515 [Nesterenkonia sp. AN1]